MRGWWLLAGGLVLALGGCGGSASSSGIEGCLGPADCQGLVSDPCHEALCDTATGDCSVRDAINGTACGDAAVCYAGGCLPTCAVSHDCGGDALCVIRRLGQGLDESLCVPASSVACAQGGCGDVQAGPCETARCDDAAGHCVLDRADDGDACGQAGACYRGVCYPACEVGPQRCDVGLACVEPSSGLAICVADNAIPCAGDAECAALVTGLCHVAACVEGTCGALPVSNGDACAAGRTCWAGACVGAGPCDPSRACSEGYACVAGEGSDACVPSGALACAGPGDCANVVVHACQQVDCDVNDGRCRATPAPDGGPCRADSVCLAGECVPACTDSATCDVGALCRAAGGEGLGGCVEAPCASPADCADLLVTTAACETVTCNTLANRCQVSPLPENASCDDGDLCNGVMRCRDGACVLAAKPSECVTPPGQGCTEIVCDPVSGACVATSAPDGLACDDGSPCTSETACSQGVCVADADHVTCTTCLYDQDCLATDDGDLCNGVSLCLEGICVWSPATLVTCEAPADPCQRAACDPATGACLQTAAPDDTPCETSTDLCDARRACRQGACVEVEPPVACEPSDDACVLTACDPASGLCTSVPLAEAALLAESFDDDVPVLGLASEAPEAVVEVATDDVSSSPAALHVHVGGLSAAPVVFLSSPLPLPAGVPVVLRAQVKLGLAVEAGDTLTVSLGADLWGWQTVLAVDAAHPPASDGWTALDVLLSGLPDGARLRLQILAAGPAGVDLRLDDVAVVRPCSWPTR